ncbi:MAG: hypothetical protein U1F16_09530 [Turneriella sp.]
MSTMKVSAKRRMRTAEDDEKIHLGILAGYFGQMKLGREQLSDDDMDFFDSYSVRTKSA